MLVSATPTISGFTAREMPQVPTRACGRGHRNHNLPGRRGGTAPFEPPSTGVHPPLKFPPYSLFRPKGSRKSSDFLSHFHGLVPDINYKYLEGFVMLGTHSKPRRGETSHIYDISVLRVNTCTLLAHVFNTHVHYCSKLCIHTCTCIYVLCIIIIIIVFPHFFRLRYSGTKKSNKTQLVSILKLVKLER